MGIKRVVDTSFWIDSKVDEFTPEDKYFMLYLLTNPFTTQLGIYEISIKQTAFQLGYSVDSVMALLERFDHKYGLIIFSKSTNEVSIKNFLRHSIVKGGKPVEDCLKKELKKVKNKSLISAVFQHISDYDNLNDTVKRIINEYENNNDNDNDNERIVNESWHDSSKQDEKPYKIIVDYLNQKVGTSYRPNSKNTVKHINARLTDGFTVDDFKTVIDKKCEEWKGTDMEQYLRPETLFGTKFESYLNAKINTKGGGKVVFSSGNLDKDKFKDWQGAGLTI